MSTIDMKSIIESYLILNKSSLVFSLLLIIVISATLYLKLEPSKRLSFRFYILIGIADLLNHICLLFDYENNTTNCHILNLLSFFSNFLFMNVNLVLAYNLHCIFILNKKKWVFSEKHYLYFIFGFSFLLTIPLILVSLLNTNICPIWNIVESPKDILLMYGLFGVWIILPTIYCAIVFILVLIKIIHVKYFKDKRNSFQSDVSLPLMKEYDSPPLISSCLRLIFYPLVPAITLLPYILLFTFKEYTPLDSLLSIHISYFSATSAGTINFIFFLFDPAIKSILNSLWEGKREQNGINYVSSSSGSTYILENDKPEIYYLL